MISLTNHDSSEGEQWGRDEIYPDVIPQLDWLVISYNPKIHRIWFTGKIGHSTSQASVLIPFTQVISHPKKPMISTSPLKNQHPFFLIPVFYPADDSVQQTVPLLGKRSSLLRDRQLATNNVIYSFSRLSISTSQYISSYIPWSHHIPIIFQTPLRFLLVPWASKAR